MLDRRTKYSMIAGIVKMQTMRPARHAFFANGVFTGTKLDSVPIAELPPIAPRRTKNPINFKKYRL